MINNLAHEGYYIITAKYKDGHKETQVVKNRITNVALDKTINAFDGIDPNMQIKYLAIGTSDAAINDNDTTLGTEIFRTQFQTSNNTATGEFTTTFAVLDTEAVATWEELGIFCGTSATATADTGTMLSRILFNFEKTNLVEADFTRVDRQIRS